MGIRLYYFCQTLKQAKMGKTDLSNRIKELRSRKGLSQEQLAEISGLSLRTIQRIENDETIPRGDTLTRLAVALQVTPDDLIDWQILEDKNVLLLLNLSQLSFLAFPLLGIIVPLVIWILKKDKVKNVNQIGKAILNFQITWTLLLFSFYTLFTLSLVLHLGIFHSIHTLLIGAAIFYIFNVLTIIVNTVKVQIGKQIYYFPAIKFLR
jgi:transcriptional regulator with XRE-family HTH domain